MIVLTATAAKKLNVKTPRALIYCFVLYRVFEVYLGSDMYHTNISPKNRIVELYYAGTPSSAKEHILTAMATDDGDLLILICTVAFGMGVNCKGVRRAIHFGPSKSVELYVQECGRAGRDGLPSTCVLLYNGLLSSHCDSDMKQYVRIEQCRREWLMITLVAQGTLRILPLTHMTAVISVQITVMYQSIPKTPIPPPGNPRAFDSR